MTRIKLVCHGGAARAIVTGVITAGMVGVPVEIECDGAWDGLIKTFVAMTASKKMVVDFVEGTTVLPFEVLKEGMRLFVGLEGRDESGVIIIPTEWADCGKIKPSAEGSHVGKPTPNEMEQLLYHAFGAFEKSKEALEKSDTAMYNSEEALEQAGYAFEQAKSFEHWYQSTKQNAQAAINAVGKMQYVSFEINEEGELVVKHPEILGGTSFRLNYNSGDLEVML